MKALEHQDRMARNWDWVKIEEMVINVSYPQEMKVILLDIFHTKFSTEVDIENLVEKCK